VGERRAKGEMGGGGAKGWKPQEERGSSGGKPAITDRSISERREEKRAIYGVKDSRLLRTAVSRKRPGQFGFRGVVQG